MARWLETAANIAMISAAVVIVVPKAYNWFHPSKMPASIVFTTKYFGKPFPGLSPAAGKDVASVLLFFSNKCHFCEESMPFYKRLTSLRTASSGFAVVGIYPEDIENQTDEETYLARHGVAVDSLQAMSFSKLMLPGTPTLLLLDRSKVVRGIWTGRLDHSKEEEVLQRLRGLCPQCGSIATANEARPAYRAMVIDLGTDLLSGYHRH